MPSSRTLSFYLVDSFTTRAFSGNPAAVVLPDPERPFRDLPDSLLQDIAEEMNLSETAFPDVPDADGIRNLRWFTPTTEVSLCGHATLAAAHVLLEAGEGEAPLRFGSRSGLLTVDRNPEGTLAMDFPADPPTPAPAPPGLLQVLGAPPEAEFLQGRRCGLVRLRDEGVLRALAPDARSLGRIPLPEGMLGVSVTAPGDEPGVDFVSRFFGPWVGVDEDPVTGMAHTVLAPYWADKLGKEEMEARQRSARGGEVRVRVAGDRVVVSGAAVSVAEGVLRLPG
jgi:PhzF family phenazine biosynthesis protein